ncbi:probable membrane-associated kinase regulator 2 [Hibiscus syriacus]|uniref:probable membrane-associated kinase regulator 2 n=1 Tax=Hibiscus syriacus TaxID=106335 RepID=UPI001923AFF9|nr:probable membrane-associated kinase regulator 2 [Hibiscus syriacus]
MEAFSLLKYWRGGGTIACVNTRSTATCTTTIVTAATPHLAVDTEDDDVVDDGPFFDLEFAVPDEYGTEENEDNVVDEGSQDSNDDIDTNSDGRCSGSEAGQNNGQSESNSSLDSDPPQFRVSFFKSASKVGIFLLRMKKSASNGTVTPRKQEKTKEPNSVNNKNRFFTVKFKVEEVPIMSLFSKDNKSHKQQTSDNNSVSDGEAKVFRGCNATVYGGSRIGFGEDNGGGWGESGKTGECSNRT